MSDEEETAVLYDEIAEFVFIMLKSGQGDTHEDAKDCWQTGGDPENEKKAFAAADDAMKALSAHCPAVDDLWPVIAWRERSNGSVR